MISYSLCNFFLYQFLVDNGLILEDVIFDKQKDQFDQDNSAFFWFTILRKLYMHSKCPTKEASRGLYTSLASYLEDILFRNSEDYGKLARTAKLFLAAETGDTDTVEDILSKFKPKTHFYLHMRSVHCHIFPSGVYDHSRIFVTPVALALRKRDVKMLSLLCSHSVGREPMFRGQGTNPEIEQRKVVTLALEAIRDDQDFFNNTVLTDLLDQQPQNTGGMYSTRSVNWSVKMAEVFHAVELNDLKKIQGIFNTSSLQSDLQKRYNIIEHSPLLAILKATYVYGRSPMIEERDMDTMWNNNLNIEKSLVLIALENRNFAMFEYLASKGFCLTDLGTGTNNNHHSSVKQSKPLSQGPLHPKKDVSSSHANNLTMWYLLIKYLLGHGAHSLVDKLCHKPDIWNGPALVGVLFTAARRHDVTLIEEIARKFQGEMSWFYGPKHLGLTAHGLLVKNGLHKEARNLQTEMVDFAPTQSVLRDTDVELSAAKSVHDFKNLIEDNPQLLKEPDLGHKSLIMALVTHREYSREKLEFLLHEKKADIQMITNDKTQNFLDTMLNESGRAERLLDILQFEEVQEVVLKTSNFLGDLLRKIISSCDPERKILTECYKLIVNMSSLEMMFFPTQTTTDNMPFMGIFEIIQTEEELFKIAAERAFNLIGEDDNKMSSLVHLLSVHIKRLVGSANYSMTQSVEEKHLALFKFFLTNLSDKAKREEAGFTSRLEDWKDRYGMTLLMRLITYTENDTSVSQANLLVKWVIEGNFFDKEYMNVETGMNLGAQFDLQHRLGIAAAGKQRNTVLGKDQLMKVKRVVRRNEKGEYEPVVPDKAGQVKMIAVDKVRVSEGGVERLSRPIITVKKPDTPVIAEETEEAKELVPNISGGKIGDVNELEHDLSGSDDLGDAVSGVGGESEEENEAEEQRAADLGLPIYDFTKKIGMWTLENIEGNNPEKIVEPEHFDKTSVVSDTDQTFKTKVNKYKIAPSASTRFLETHTVVETPSKYFANKTTLLLLACRTQNWEVVSSLLGSYKLNISHKDANGSNGLHLAIKAGKGDICMAMIDTIDVRSLKADVNAENKTALMLVSELSDKDIVLESCHSIELRYSMLKKNILEKTGQKERNTLKPRAPVDKSQAQILRLNQGTSCGFQFKQVGEGVWRCQGSGCGVEVRVESDDNRLEDPQHVAR